MLWKVRDGKKMGVDEIRAEEKHALTLSFWTSLPVAPKH